jgi:hypothetical protein
MREYDIHRTPAWSSTSFVQTECSIGNAIRLSTRPVRRSRTSKPAVVATQNVPSFVSKVARTTLLLNVFASDGFDR